MRIAYVITRGDEVGGAQVHVSLLARWMIGAGHEVSVIAGGDASYFEPLRSCGVNVQPLIELGRDVSPLADVVATWKLVRLLRTSKPDLISCHSSKAGILGRIAGRLCGIPTVFTAHGWAFAEGAPKLRSVLATMIERFVAPFACRIVTVSRRDVQLARARRVAGSKRLVLVRNGMPDVSPSLRARPTAKPPTLITVARFAPPKDFETLFQALQRISSLPWRMVLVGDGPDLETTRRRASELGLSDRIEFLGRRSDIAEILAESDCALLVSKWEGLPRSLVEALRAGLPIVASAVGGVDELVEEGENGFLVRRGDASMLAERLRALVTDADLREAFGRNSRSLYERSFTWDRVLAETSAVYAECAQR